MRGGAYARAGSRGGRGRGEGGSLQPAEGEGGRPGLRGGACACECARAGSREGGGLRGVLKTVSSQPAEGEGVGRRREGR